MSVADNAYAAADPPLSAADHASAAAALRGSGELSGEPAQSCVTGNTVAVARTLLLVQDLPVPPEALEQPRSGSREAHTD